MQKRSPAKVLFYSALTLGLYDLLWLSKTRRELMAETGIRIQRMTWLVALYFFRIIALGVALLCLFAILTAPSKMHIDQACWSEYVLSTAPETSATITLSTKCRNQLEQRQAAIDHKTSATRVLIVVTLLALASTVVYPRWLKSYIRAVEQVTNGKLNQTAAMFLLYAAPIYGTALVQQAFNNPSSLPTQFGTFRLEQLKVPQIVENNKTLKRTLTTIAVMMVVAFILLIAALVALSYYGTH